MLDILGQNIGTDLYNLMQSTYGCAQKYFSDGVHYFDDYFTAKTSSPINGLYLVQV